MSNHQTLIEGIRKSRRKNGVTAYFDLDRTLISQYTAMGLLREQIASKQLSAVDALQLVVVALSTIRGTLAFEDALKTSALMLEGETEARLEGLANQAFCKHWNSAIYPEACDLILAHRGRGHRVVIISSATRYQVAPIAAELDVTDFLCSELETRDGVFTGELDGRPCWGEGKLEAAERDATQHGMSLDHCYFYSDAWEDLPLLERVGHPCALNPDRKLEEHSKKNSWPICHFTSRSRPGLEELIRTGLVWGSFAPALALGAISWLRDRSLQRAASTTFQQWSNLGLMFAGIRLNVSGHEHLWTHRPAIFVMNHQSLLDGFILPLLVQDELTAMGKKEASTLPVIGRTVEAAGFILFDRSDPKSAREACDRAAEKIRNGTSLLIAPEGTRSHTNRLKPFKKGAFHIALQTRVPIVPVVIRNATELWPRGSNFVRPGTVDVEVLPPVSTKNWKESTLQQHVNDVRKMFLKSLGQEELR